MRRSKADTEATRVAIVEAAADLIRQQGISKPSLGDMMEAAGLTHGGFYRHFRNKAALVAEAVAAAGAKTVETLGAKASRNAAIDAYLSKRHRDAETPVCPFAAAGSELARAEPETKAAATATLRALFATLGDDAVVTMSTMVGALTLSRIVDDPALSADILDRAKKHLQR